MKFCPFVLEILSGNKILISIKGQNSSKNKQNMTGNNHNLDLVNINSYIIFGKLYPSVLKILSRKDIVTSIKGHNSCYKCEKMKHNDPNLDIVNINA